VPGGFFFSYQSKQDAESSTLPGGVKDENDDLNFKSNKDSADDRLHESSEGNILASLFESSGVHSALKHDEIMDAAKPEDLIVEREGNYERCVGCIRHQLRESSRSLYTLCVRSLSDTSGRTRHGSSKGIQKETSSSGP
jgi:hypothetical protein